MLERMKPYTLSAFLLLLVGYLGVQARTGERGLLSGGERAALLEARETQLERLRSAGTLRSGSAICGPKACPAICWRSAPGLSWASAIRATM